MFLWIVAILWIVGWALWQIHQGRASVNWPETEAVVTFSRVVNGFDAAYRLRLTYQYTVDGLTYTGRRIQYGDVLGSIALNSPMDFVPIGTRFTIRYEPNRKVDATIFPGFDLTAVRLTFALAGGIAFLLVWL